MVVYIVPPAADSRFESFNKQTSSACVFPGSSREYPVLKTFPLLLSNTAPTQYAVCTGSLLRPSVMAKRIMFNRTAFVALNAGRGATATAKGAAKTLRVPALAEKDTGAVLKSAVKTPFVATSSIVQVQKRFYAAKAAVTTMEEGGDATVPPDQSKYLKNLSNYDDTASRNLAYLLIGTYGFVQASAVKNIATDLLVSLAPSADVLALAKVEVDMASIPEGKNVVIKWRGKPVFIRHRTADEIAEANTVNLSELRHPETDADRVKDPAWLVMLGVCTHLGCVPMGEAGEYNGWFCPCHGSHYDISGRIRKGPAPLNMEIPPYDFNDGKIVIG
ncbi:hypothetical protein HDU96_008535 [Phlyctochytrium bullatum]|nr:hypothetical protein HDU96_008535 [Phlyctochytrium bullatum]